MDLKPSIKKAIYLDNDVIALGDVKELYNEDLEDKTVGAICDIQNEYRIKENDSIGIKNNHIYMGSGVLLINCDKWREQNLTEKIINIGKEKRLFYPDQDALNILFNDNRYKLLDVKYCFINERYGFSYKFVSNLHNLKIDLEYNLKHIVLMHFAGSKPWKEYFYKDLNKDKSVRFFNDFWYYAGMTPFLNALMAKYIYHINISNTNTNTNSIHNTLSSILVKKTEKSIKLFNLIPVLKYKIRPNCTRILLFGFVPLFKIKEK
jgi:lipopolysaccharide biosynthesis glycosyltransferase